MSFNEKIKGFGSLKSWQQSDRHFVTDHLLCKLSHWRDGKRGHIVRRIVFGMTTIPFLLANCVEIAAKLAIAILSSPLELCGIKLSKTFLKGAGFSMVDLALIPYTTVIRNIADEKIYDENFYLDKS